MGILWLTLCSLAILGAYGTLLRDNFTKLSSNYEAKIVNGYEVVPHSRPFIIGIFMKISPETRSLPELSHWCGGSIIDAQHILSAAHCFYDNLNPDNYTIVAGHHNILNDVSNLNPLVQKVDIEKITIHPRYDEKREFLNDIAIVTLKQNLKFNSNVATVKLISTMNSSPYYNARVAGWGRLAFGAELSNVLMEAEILHQPKEKCDSCYTFFDAKSQICAGVDDFFKDSCSGDSGGPLTTKTSNTEEWDQTGIVSYGVKCAFPRYFGVYTRVSHYLPWIRETVGNPSIPVFETPQSCVVNGGKEGVCISTDSCNGQSFPNACQGPAHIQCCIEETRQTCEVSVNGARVVGVCKGIDKCHAQKQAGLCGGDSNIQCCYGETQCDVQLMPCDQAPCKNGGICQNSGNTYNCICPSGYSGPNCESTGTCAQAPCKNGGACYNNGNSYYCRCQNGYTGPTCASGSTEPCAQAPCQNGGTCQSSGNSYYCLCPNGYSGPNCASSETCAQGPCKNGGVCYNNGNSYYCHCQNGYTGPKCESVTG